MEIKRSALLPNLCTVGNGICGFAALMQLTKVTVEGRGSFDHPEYFTMAALLVFLGMAFDVFDGKIARMAKGTSELGAQLDSFCDLVTFGAVPAVMVVMLNRGEPSRLWQNMVWFFALVYFLGALLRLARFNVENTADESSHLCFKGLPTPAAAGCVASLFLFQRYVLKFQAEELVLLSRFIDKEWLQLWVGRITLVLPFLSLVLGPAMVLSRLKFAHMGTKLFSAGHSFETFVYMVFAAVLLAMLPELVLPLTFLGYLVWTPARAAYGLVVNRREAAGEENDAGP